MTVFLACLSLLLLIAAGVFALLWRSAALHNTGQALLIRHQCERIDGYRAELDNLSIAGPPAAAVAALTPDDPSLLPAEVEQWLRTHTRES